MADPDRLKAVVGPVFAGVVSVTSVDPLNASWRPTAWLGM